MAVGNLAKDGNGSRIGPNGLSGKNSAMHPNTAKKVLSDPETLDIGQTAEAVREIKRIQDKQDRPKSPLNSIRAHTAWMLRQAAQERLRQKLKEAWNKRKKV